MNSPKASALTTDSSSTRPAAQVQTKLSVGAANDGFEREADRVADHVTQPAAVALPAVGSRSAAVAPTISRLAQRQPEAQRQEEEEEAQPKLQRQAEEEEAQPKLQRQEEEEEAQPKLQRQAEKEEAQPKLQRQEEEEEAQPKLQRQEEEEEVQPKLQRQAEEEEEAQTKLQRSTNVQTRKEARANRRDKSMFPTLNKVEEKLFANKGKGEKLDDTTRTEMEVGFGADFGAVRVHTGGDAVAMTRDLKAQAFTHGKDLFFNTGKFEPDSMRGKILLAHELTHVVQQGAAEQKVPEQKIETNNRSRDAAPPEPSDKTAVQAEQKTAESLKENEPKPGEPAAADANDAAEAPVSDEAPQEAAVDHKADDKPGGKIAVEAKTGRGKSKKGGKKTAKGGGVAAFLRRSTRAVFESKKAGVARLATSEKTKDPAEAKLAQTEKSVVPPGDESKSRANAGQVATVDAAREPEPDEAKARQEFSQALDNAVPTTLEEVDKFKDSGKGRVVGQVVKSTVTKDAQDVKGTYQEIENAPEPEPPAQEPETLPELESAPATAPINMGDGVIGEVQPEQTDLSEFDKGSDELLEKEGMQEEHLEMVDEGELAEAKADRKQVKSKTSEGPREVKLFEQQQKQQVSKELQKEEQEGKQNMQAERQKKLLGAKDDQEKTKSTLEQKREAVTTQINSIYETANKTVKQKLEQLEKKSLKDFDDGERLATKSFEDNVKRRIDAFKRRRYDRFGGSLLWAKDKLFGMDELPEVSNIFETEKSRFITAIDANIKTITAENKRVIQECKDLVATARKDIQAFVDGLGPQLRDAGQNALKDIRGKLDALDKSINDKEKELKKKLEAKREAAIKAIEEKIEKMKEEMSGLLSKLGNLLLNAMVKFFKWALKKAGLASEQLMGVINKGKAVIKAIVGDPIAFIGNIVKAVKGGIDLFVTNIRKHLIGGLISWLTGAMADVPITLPSTWDLKGILSLVLQILGLTWDRIRKKLVRKLGEKVVRVAETTVDIVKKLISEGPMALWEMIKEKAASIKQQVMEGIRNWAITQLVKQAIIKLVSFLNPAGAIIQAILAIYNTVMFFVENWQRIVDMVTTVFNSIGKIAMGQISAAAQAVERVMAMTIPIILNFLSRLIGLSGIGKAVSRVIKKIRRPIDKVVDKVIGFVAKKAKALAGIAKSGAQKLKNLIFPSKRFSAGGEQHKIWVKKGARPRLMISSRTQPAEAFLKGFENQAGGSLSAGKKKAIADARKVIKDINKESAKLAKAKTEATQAKSNRALLDLEVKLSEFIRQAIGTEPLKVDQLEYNLEGLAGTYASMPKPKRDDMTADHQPQAAILQWAASQEYFGSTSPMAQRAAGRAAAGFAINLQSGRHKEGRTYGHKGGSTKKSFVTNAKAAVKGEASRQKKRDKVVNLLKHELQEDVGAMRTVVSQPANFRDINKNRKIPAPEKKKLVTAVKSQILSGESKVASQDLDSLKSA